MRVAVQSSAGELAAAAEALLLSDAASNTILLSSLAAERSVVDAGAWWSAVAFDLRRAPAGCALRDRAAVFISTGSNPAARALGRVLRTAHWQQSIVGPEKMASECARSLGLPARTQFVLLLHTLRGAAQNAQRPPPGRMRAANAADLDLLVQWALQFRNEARLTESDEDARQRVAAQLQRGKLRLWLDPADRPRSFAGYSSVPPEGARVAPVYTPPDARGRGYAQALVAALCADLQQAGARSVCLFTDTTNPTSNALYRRIGFEPTGLHLHLVVSRPPDSVGR